MKVQYIGRTLGEASGWDGDLGEVWWFYDFEPKADSGLPVCKCLQLDDLAGTINAQDDAGNTIDSFDTITLLSRIAKD